MVSSQQKKAVPAGDSLIHIYQKVGGKSSELDLSVHCTYFDAISVRLLEKQTLGLERLYWGNTIERERESFAVHAFVSYTRVLAVLWRNLYSVSFYIGDILNALLNFPRYTDFPNEYV